MIETDLLKKKIEESGYRFNWIAKQLNLSPFGIIMKKKEKKYFFKLFSHLK